MGWDFVVLGATGMQGRITSKDLLEMVIQFFFVEETNLELNTF
jgi:hypothetical protein